jgi:hypothetical protein
MLQPIATNRPSMRDVRMHSLFQDDMYRSVIPCSRLPFECFHSHQILVPATVYLTSPSEYALDMRDVLIRLRSFCPLFAKHVHVNIAASDALEFGRSGIKAPVPVGTTAPVSSMLQRGITLALAGTLEKVKPKKVKSNIPNDEFDYSTRWVRVWLSYPDCTLVSLFREAWRPAGFASSSSTMLTFKHTTLSLKWPMSKWPRTKMLFAQFDGDGANCTRPSLNLASSLKPMLSLSSF